MYLWYTAYGNIIPISQIHIHIKDLIATFFLSFKQGEKY